MTLWKLLVGTAGAITVVGCGKSPPANSPRSAVASTIEDSDVAPTPTPTDVSIVRRAEELLSEVPAWNHFGDRNCEASARSWNLYCALHRASLDITGTFQHRSAAMQEVRWVVDERTRGKDLEHRLMDYNNLPETTFTEVKGVLAEARRRLEAKVGMQVAVHE